MAHFQIVLPTDTSRRSKRDEEENEQQLEHGWEPHSAPCKRFIPDEIVGVSPPANNQK